jgi:hypothetical protein
VSLPPFTRLLAADTGGVLGINSQHAQNVELKQKRATRPRLNLGQSTFPRKSNMANMDCSPVAEDAVC